MAGTSSRAILLLVLCSTGLAGQRAPEHPLRRAEQVLGTASHLDWGFHRVVEDPHGLGFKFPGFLVGVEKASRNRLGVVDTGRTAPVPISYAPPGSNAEERRVLRRVLNDPERTFVSHMVAYDIRGGAVPYIQPTFVHNAYARSAAAISYHGWESYGRAGEYPFYNPAASPYADSWTALDKLGAAVRERLQAARSGGSPVSHVIVASMGWNTTELEAIRNYNSIFGNLLAQDAASARSALAAPIVVGLSWPSRWDVPGVSYPNKADDADEVGFLWVNYLINHVLMPLKREFGFRTVVVGHSFGARLTTRGVFSGPVLGVLAPQEKVDLVVGLQGAFSANRFIPERAVGLEGAPYARYRDWANQVVLTWSPFDRANPAADIATGANNVGGTPGYRRTLQYPAHFQQVSWREAGDWLPVPRERDGRILMVDASDLVRFGTYEKGGSAHSDIYHAAMGRFLLDLIRAYAP